MIPSNPTETVPKTNYQERLTDLAKESSWSGRLIVKEGTLKRGSFLQALFEDFKGFLGYKSGTNNLLIEYKTIEFLEEIEQEIQGQLPDNDLDLIQSLAVKAGLTKKNIDNHKQLSEIVQKLLSPIEKPSDSGKISLREKFFFNHVKDLSGYTEVTSKIKQIFNSEVDRINNTPELKQNEEIPPPIIFAQEQEVIVESVSEETEEQTIHEQKKGNQEDILSQGEAYNNSEHREDLEPEESAPTAKIQDAAPATEEIQKPFVDKGKTEKTYSSEKINSTATENIVTPEITRDLLDEFWVAMILKGTDKLEAMLKETPDIVNTRFTDGTLPLNSAIRHSEPLDEVIKLLVKFADCNLRDANGFDAFDVAVQMNKDDLAKNILRKNLDTAWVNAKESCKTVDAVTSAINEGVTGLDENKKKICEEVFSRGYVGFNPLLMKAIQAGDYKTFVRTVIATDGAILNERDPENGNNLLHLLIENPVQGVGLEAIICFLLQPKISVGAENPPANLLLQKNVSGVTPLELVKIFCENSKAILNEMKADSKKDSPELQSQIKKFEEVEKYWNNIAELLDSRTNPEKSTPELKAKIQKLETEIKSYKDGIENWNKEHAEEAEIFKNVAKHGGAQSGMMGSSGHNRQVFANVYQKDLEGLAQAAAFKASFETIGMSPKDEMIDPLGSSFQLKDLHETVKGMGEGAQKLAKDDNVGKGKTLLDMAVLLSDGSQRSRDVITFLMSQRKDSLILHPTRSNDEGGFFEKENALKMALIKGDLQSALVMRNYDALKSQEDYTIDEKNFDEMYRLLRLGSEMRDPLYVSWEKTKQLGFSLAYFGAHLWGGHASSSSVGFASLLTSGVATKTFREKLTERPPEPVYYPQAVIQLAPWMQKMHQLEMLHIPERMGIPGSHIGALSMTALGAYGATASTFKKMNTVTSHLTERPLKTMLKMGAEVLPTIQSWFWFGNSLSEAFSKPPEKIDPCKITDEQIEEVSKLPTVQERLAYKDPKTGFALKGECVEHAKIIFSNSWNQTIFDKKLTPERFVKMTFRREAINLSVDHGGNKDDYVNFLAAKETLLNGPQIQEKVLSLGDVSGVDGIPISQDSSKMQEWAKWAVSSSLGQTAAKVAGIGVVNKMSQGSDTVWSIVSWGNLIIGGASTAYGLASKAYDAASSYYSG